jgi:threonyl-tRNA synthetase
MADLQLETRRHSAAHTMAAAVKRLFPDAKFGVGPVVENGFYYDIDIGRPVTPEDIAAIDKEMQAIVGQNPAFTREELPIDEAIKLFQQMGQTYKVELLMDLKTKGTTKVSAEEAQDVDPQNIGTVSLYRTGEFVDLCRGPHVTEAKEIGAWKLWKTAGAYWRGKETNPQMQRIYGLCFATKKELDAFEAMLAEAEKRDHRKLGKDLGLFTIIDEIGPGLPLFYPKGAILRRNVETFIQERQERRGYVPIWIPHITKGHLYEMSGHLQKYDAMYPPMELEGESAYYLKPMNCPHFMMLYRTQPHSYRELPVRYTCTTTNYRYEKSGELSGLTRVRSLTQDDCHVFAMPEQIEAEINLMLDMIAEVYEAFQFKDFWVRISIHDPANPGKYIGDPEIWSQSEGALARLIEGRGWEHAIGVGEAAFYGPKLDFIAKDVLGREWQLSTIQLDMNLPERFELEYAAADGTKKRPVVIHRAILGSTERFLGILIEHFAGAFPLWLAPVQIAILPVADRHIDFAQSLAMELGNHGLRCEVDASAESVGKKIRNAEKMKYPVMLVVGDKEMEGGPLTVRRRGEKDQQAIGKQELLQELLKEIAERKA